VSPIPIPPACAPPSPSKVFDPRKINQALQNGRCGNEGGRKSTLQQNHCKGIGSQVPGSHVFVPRPVRRRPRTQRAEFKKRYSQFYLEVAPRWNQTKFPSINTPERLKKWTRRCRKGRPFFRPGNENDMARDGNYAVPISLNAANIFFKSATSGRAGDLFQMLVSQCHADAIFHNEDSRPERTTIPQQHDTATGGVSGRSWLFRVMSERQLNPDPELQQSLSSGGNRCVPDLSRRKTVIRFLSAQNWWTITFPASVGVEDRAKSGISNPQASQRAVKSSRLVNGPARGIIIQCPHTERSSLRKTASQVNFATRF